MPELKLPEGEGAVKPDGGLPQVFRDLGAKLQLLAPDRMLQREALGVQPETMAGDRGAVQRVRVHRMTDGREVDHELVRPPCLEPYAEHRVPTGVGEHLEA